MRSRVLAATLGVLLLGAATLMLARAAQGPAREVQLVARDMRLYLPDLPGTAWPAGYGSAHCHYHLDEPLTLAQVAAFVDAGDVAGLERRIREIYAELAPGAARG